MKILEIQFMPRSGDGECASGVVSRIKLKGYGNVKIRLHSARRFRAVSIRQRTVTEVG